MLKLFILAIVILLHSYTVVSEQFNLVSLMIKYHSALGHKSRDIGKFKGIPKLPQLEGNMQREIFHYEHTIVIRDSRKDDDKVRRCELMEVYEEKDKEEAFYQLQILLNVNITEVPMDKIMNFIKDCDSIDDNIIELEPKSLELKTTAPKSSEEENPILSGIVPGTKWCGFGDIAKNFHDLGKRRNVDRCCRSHDMCPINIRSKDKRYNLTNDAMYTKSHCICDEEFYECLKEDYSWTAQLTGSLYFNIVQPDCIDGLPDNPDEEMQIVPAIKNW